MKAVLKFDLSVPEDLDDFRAACKAVEMAAVLWQLTHNAAKQVMWDIDQRIDDGEKLTPHDGAAAVFNEITRMLADEGIDVSEMVR